ncbi:SpaH/EbpB family LPXTG-anchored major pilin [Enterococcus hulanensis]|uniref:SpaH/EbpB family LPXTG-anchored major pilin n=1 Tax=Enterococcus hulanensis TaxID=2559929 RepID=UPI0010F5B177|nr:SpaH/EbpB family LPXTG-anchored major pilin [Enterococcus hulanensis]
MKMKKVLITKIALTTTLFTSLSVMTPVGNILVAHAEGQNISSNAVSDNTSDRSITIWKYEINNTSELGDRGDGINPDPSKAPDLNGKKLMEGVHFELIKVKPLNTTALKDPLKQKEGTDWEEDTSFTKMTGKTDANGKLTFDVGTGKAADGIYLIREVVNPDTGKYDYMDKETGALKEISSPMAPFFAHLPQTQRDDTGKLIYDVHVYPKNIVTDTELDKTVEGGKGYSIQAGNSFQWEATTKLPSGLYSKVTQDMTIINRFDRDGNALPDLDVAAGTEIYADYFEVVDEIDQRLALEDIEVRVLGEDGVTWTTLTNGEEYEVSLNGTPITSPNKVSADANSVKKVLVSLTNTGMKKVEEDKDQKIQVIYKVKALKDFNGTISNKYDVNYLIPGQKPFTGTSDEPEYFDGGFKISKSSEDKTNKLAGAEFYISESEADAKVKKFLASDGKSYTLNDDGTATPALPTGVTFLTTTSDKDGVAKFDGLKLDWFTDSNGDGKQDPAIPSEATWEKDKIKKSYWIVETKSPTGYELLKNPVEVVVTLDSHTNVVVDVENKEKTDLPFTGGDGMTLMIVIALGAIAVGTTAVVIDKKRRAV